MPASTKRQFSEPALRPWRRSTSTVVLCTAYFASQGARRTSTPPWTQEMRNLCRLTCKTSDTWLSTKEQCLDRRWSSGWTSVVGHLSFSQGMPFGDWASSWSEIPCSCRRCKYCSTIRKSVQRRRSWTVALVLNLMLSFCWYHNFIKATFDISISLASCSRLESCCFSEQQRSSKDLLVTHKGLLSP